VSVRVGLALLFTAALSQATTLVAIWSPGELLLAADSAVTQNLGPLAVQGSTCKIGQQSGTYFAFSGLVDDQSLNYHVSALAQQAAAAGGSVEVQAQRFVAAVRDPLVKALAGLQRDEPDQFRFLQQGHPALQAIFAGTEDGQPTLVIAGFGVGPDGQLGDFVRTVARGDDGRGPRIIYAGQQSQIRTYIKAHPDWYQGDRAALVRQLVQMEIDSSDGTVGGPVDVLAIETNGAHWVQQKDSCR
jgi:hypothetical protein